MFAAAPGDGKERGLNRLAHDGLVKRVVGGHWSPRAQARRDGGRRADRGLQPAARLHLAALPRDRRPPARPAPEVGLGTFVDPRHGGGKLNRSAREDLVELIEIDGEEWLFYKAFPIHVAFIRGTTADPDGNITMEREALTLDNLAIAMAAKTRQGFVIAQVERIGGRRRPEPAGRSRSRASWSTASSWRRSRAPPRRPMPPAYNPAFSGELRVPLDSHRAAAARRAQGHRPALRVRAAAGRRRQSRHRHAGGRGRGGHRGEAARAT